MASIEDLDNSIDASTSFFAKPGVQVDEIKVGRGVPIGIERVSNPALGIGGAYGTWGESYSNQTLQDLVAYRLGRHLETGELMDLSSLGFVSRHHIIDLSDRDDIDLEVEVGARMLREAASACGWKPEEVEGVLIGMSGPVSLDYTERIAKEAGIPEDALKVSVHKACDGSVGALHLAMNPDLDVNRDLDQNLAEELKGKKVLVGGIEGLSRFTKYSFDFNALQLFGNGAGVIGVIPGKTLKFLVGKAHEVFDEQGVLAVRMYYPYPGIKIPGAGSMIQVIKDKANHIRIAGLMHEPDDERPVVMAGPMGMVKLFVRSGVQVVKDVYQMYQDKLNELGEAEKSIRVAIVHHANYKINQLKAKHLVKEGIQLPMPWVLSEFGNVSAASNMIAFMRQLPSLNPGDHILFDGFGAGTYYDVMALVLGGAPA